MHSFNDIEFILAMDFLFKIKNIIVLLNSCNDYYFKKTHFIFCFFKKIIVYCIPTIFDLFYPKDLFYR
jgi:hypothetical protein